MADVFPPALSKGDRAKVIIASVLAMEPEIVILDEPTSGQVYRGCYQVMDIAKAINAQGRSVVVVTHHMALVAEYTSRTIVMAKTRVLMDGDTDKVFAETDLLATTHIKAPQITQVSMAVESQLHFGKTVLSVEECAQKLAQRAGLPHVGPWQHPSRWRASFSGPSPAPSAWPSAPSSGKLWPHHRVDGHAHLHLPHLLGPVRRTDRAQKMVCQHRHRGHRRHRVLLLPRRGGRFLPHRVLRPGRGAQRGG